MKIECPICRKENYFKLSRIKKGAKFCSRKCYGISKIGTPHPISNETRRKISEVNKIALKGRKLTDEHKQNIGKASSIQMKGSTRTYESKRKQSMTRQGITNIDDWKGFVTSPNRNERIRFRNEMQKKVFERDNYHCVICGDYRDLQVDHIQSWADFVELRFDIENCRTLCAKCHYLLTFKRSMPENIKGWGHNLLGGASK